MTVENWINVAMIIAVIITAGATALGPVLGSYVQVRMSQPKPTPDASQPTALTEGRVGRLLNSFIRSRAMMIAMWVGAVILILSFCFLPLDRLRISSLVVGVMVPPFATTVQVLDKLIRMIERLNLRL